MQICLQIHLEPLPEEPFFSWWAESDQLEGFSAAADHLPELLSLAEEGARQMLPGEEIELVAQIAPGLFNVPVNVADDTQRPESEHFGYDVVTTEPRVAA